MRTITKRIELPDIGDRCYHIGLDEYGFVTDIDDASIKVVWDDETEHYYEPIEFENSYWTGVYWEL